MGPLLLGIDAGTSNVKASIYDTKGKLIKCASVESTILKSDEGHMEMDLNVLMFNLKRLLKEITLGYKDDIKAIGFSVTSPTLVLLDKKLNPIRPGVIYLDNRSSEEVSKYAEMLGGREGYFSKIGNNPSPSTCTVGLLNWLKREEPESWERVYKIGYLNTFLAAKLTGEVAVDPTIASLSGLVNIGNPYCWDEELVKISGINPDILPDIKPSFHKVGVLQEKIAKKIGLPAGIPVSIGSADTAAASFALGLKQHGDVFESMGTSGVLTFCLTKPKFDKAFMNRSHVIPGLWLAHGAMSTTGAAIEWAKDIFFSQLEDISDMERIVLNTNPGSSGIIFLPYLSGERSPVFDPKACGVFFGLNLETNKKDMARAIYEGSAYGVKQLYLIAQNRWNVAPEFIRCVGGVCRSSLALQLRSDILNIPYKSMEAGNAAALGAAFMAGMAANIYKDIDEIPNPNKFLKSVCPNSENMDIYDKCFSIYQKLYPSLKPLMHEKADNIF